MFLVVLCSVMLVMVVMVVCVLLGSEMVLMFFSGVVLLRKV